MRAVLWVAVACAVWCGQVGADDPEPPRQPIKAGVTSGVSIAMTLIGDDQKPQVIERATQQLLGDQDVQRWVREYYRAAQERLRENGLPSLDPPEPEPGIKAHIIKLSMREAGEPYPDDVVVIRTSWDVPAHAHRRDVIGVAVFTRFEEVDGRPYVAWDAKALYPWLAWRPADGIPWQLPIPTNQLWPNNNEVAGVVALFVYDPRGDQTVVLDAVAGGFSTKVIEEHKAADAPESTPADN